MSEKGEMGATGGKSEMSELCSYRSGGKRSALQFAPFSRVSLSRCLLLVTRLSPVARRMCASEAHA
jgi:hypothetical protein